MRLNVQASAEATNGEGLTDTVASVISEVAAALMTNLSVPTAEGSPTHVASVQGGNISVTVQRIDGPLTANGTVAIAAASTIDGTVTVVHLSAGALRNASGNESRGLGRGGASAIAVTILSGELADRTAGLPSTSPGSADSSDGRLDGRLMAAEATLVSSVVGVHTLSSTGELTALDVPFEVTFTVSATAVIGGGSCRTAGILQVADETERCNLGCCLDEVAPQNGTCVCRGPLVRGPLCSHELFCSSIRDAISEAASSRGGAVGVGCDSVAGAGATVGCTCHQLGYTAVFMHKLVPRSTLTFEEGWPSALGAQVTNLPSHRAQLLGVLAAGYTLLLWWGWRTDRRACYVAVAPAWLREPSDGWSFGRLLWLHLRLHHSWLRAVSAVAGHTHCSTLQCVQCVCNSCLLQACGVCLFFGAKQCTGSQMLVGSALSAVASALLTVASRQAFYRANMRDRELRRFFRQNQAKRQRSRRAASGSAAHAAHERGGNGAGGAVIASWKPHRRRGRDGDLLARLRSPPGAGRGLTDGTGGSEGKERRGSPRALRKPPGSERMIASHEVGHVGVGGRRSRTELGEWGPSSPLPSPPASPTKPPTTASEHATTTADAARLTFRLDAWHLVLADAPSTTEDGRPASSDASERALGCFVPVGPGATSTRFVRVEHVGAPLGLPVGWSVGRPSDGALRVTVARSALPDDLAKVTPAALTAAVSGLDQGKRAPRRGGADGVWGQLRGCQCHDALLVAWGWSLAYTALASFVLLYFWLVASVEEARRQERDLHEYRTVLYQSYVASLCQSIFLLDGFKCLIITLLAPQWISDRTRRDQACDPPRGEEEDGATGAPTQRGMREGASVLGMTKGPFVPTLHKDDSSMLEMLPRIASHGWHARHLLQFGLRGVMYGILSLL